MIPRLAPRLSPVIWLLCLAGVSISTGCTGFDLLNAPISSVGYDRNVDIPYGSIPRQKLDIYKPRGVKPNAPVVIFFYGGEWAAGEKGNYRFAGEALSSEGFIAVLPDYRLYPGVTFPTFVEDAAKSVRWVHDNISRYGGDPTHIYLMGHSAGAHIAVLLSLDPHYLQAVGMSRGDIRATAGLSGPYHFKPYGDDRLVFNMQPGDETPPEVMEPIHFADGHAPPMLFQQGGKDQLVDPRNATEMEEKICRDGGYAKAIVYPDMAHEGIVIALAAPWRWLAPVLHDAAVFFKEH